MKEWTNSQLDTISNIKLYAEAVQDVADLVLQEDVITVHLHSKTMRIDQVRQELDKVLSKTGAWIVSCTRQDFEGNFVMRIGGLQ
jgi:hypothetical protein